MKVVLGKLIAGLIVSPRLRSMQRAKAALRRRLSGASAQIHYCHQVDDPYSQLMLQILPVLAANGKTRLAVHIVPPPDAAAAPDRERLQGWSRSDAAALAEALGLAFSDSGHQPDPEQVALAQRAAVATLKRDLPVAAALRELENIGRALWSGDAQTLSGFATATAAETETGLATTAAWRQQHGHYLGGTLYFEGEWYWGVDRLYHLEQRLRAQGLLDARAAPIVQLPKVCFDHHPEPGRRPTLHFFCSPRSPYTYLSIPRVVKLAEHYGAQLEMRFVLPMIMRGLPVPTEKRLYIARDTKREAEALGMPFGHIADPVGKPTERCLAVLHHVLNSGTGREMAFFESFMRGVWAEGIDAGSDAGLCKIAERVGIDAAFVMGALADESWREVAQANRDEMLACGLWGVPTFRIDDGPARWGQDRLWQVERDLIAATKATHKS